MTTFAIMTSPNNPKMSEFLAALDRTFGSNYQKVDEGQYLASLQEATSGQIAEKLGLNGEVGQYVVVTSAGWGGWHQNSLWEWMRIQDKAR